MLKNLLIAVLAILSGSLMLENQRVCAQLLPCLWLQGVLRNQDAQRQQQVDAILSRVRLLQGHSPAGQGP
ncbi:MAG: hypothetical protein ACKO5M_03800 [Vulcanococcus sp.]